MGAAPAAPAPAGRVVLPTDRSRVGTTWVKGPGFVGLMGVTGNHRLMPEDDEDPFGLPLVEGDLL